jgi:hypothetical protein
MSVIFTPNTAIKSADVNLNFALAVRFVPIEGVIVVDAVNPADTNWTAVDVTAQTSATTYAVMLTVGIASAITAFRLLCIRPTGSSTTQATSNIACRNSVASASSAFSTYTVSVNTSQSFDYSVNNADVSSVNIIVIGYWETI